MSRKKEKIAITMIVGDVILMHLSIFLALLIRYRSFSFIGNGILTDHIVFMIILHILWIVFLFFLDFYDFPVIRDIPRFASHILILVLLCFSSGSIYFYLLPITRITPKTILFLDVILLALLLTVFRFIFQKVIEHRGLFESVLLIGSKEEALLIDNEQLRKNHMKLLEYIEPFKFDMYSQIKKADPDIVVLGEEIFSKIENGKRVSGILPLGYRYVNFFDFYSDLYKKIPLFLINDVWILKEISEKGNINIITKRMFDIVFSIFLLIITFPIWPFIALFIKLTSAGPIIYTQERVGKNENLFNIYKFRTMYKDAEANGPQWSDDNDPRITPFGRFLRKTHLDEMPQLINILKGDLSFVGPRPERPVFVRILKEQIPYYDLRHLVKPGITGWAQINYNYANSAEDTREKLQYDLYYIANSSLLMDISIVLKTLRHIFINA